jgi:SulP family sulfate permease
MNPQNFAETRTNILSGLTVALALVPEAIAFALAAHVSPLVGLYAAFMVSMISGAAGSLAVVMVALVVQHGAEYLFATVVLMGVLQILFGLLKFGKFIRMVPHPVMLGFVNGLAIVIFMAQLVHFKVAGAGGAMVWMQGAPLYTMLGLVALDHGDHLSVAQTDHSDPLHTGCDCGSFRAGHFRRHLNQDGG